MLQDRKYNLEKKFQETMTKLGEMNLIDQFLFDEVVEHEDAFESVISIVTGKDIKLLDKARTEKEYRISPELRKVRLDSVGMGTDRKIYMVEMQKRDTGNLQKRSRLYQGHVDVSLMEPGSKDFNSLKDVCEIMITPFDIFGRGLYRYTFRGVCVECPDLEIGDGAWRIFINTQGKNREKFSREFLDFMGYITDSTDEYMKKVDSERIWRIHRRVMEIKKSEKMGVKAMQLWEEMAWAKEDARAEGLAEGRAEGRAEGKTEDILDLLSDLGDVPGDIKEKISGESDENVLRRWLRLAARAERIEDFRREMNAGGV